MFASGVQLPLRTVWKVKSGYRSVSYWWPKEQLSNINLNCKADTISNKVLFMISGNPGVPEFYIEFVASIHKELGNVLDIILVGHHGQSVDDLDNFGYPEKDFGLQHQLNHKLECLDELVEKYSTSASYFLVGHSVGAWICEQLVKRRPNINVVQVFSLFPALYRLRETENGFWMSKLLFPPIPRMIISKLVLALNLVPLPFLTRVVSLITKQSAKNALISSLMFLKYPFYIFYCTRASFLSLLVASLSNFLVIKTPSVIYLTCMINTSPVVESALSMAYDEMIQIYDIDMEFYTTNAEKFTFYYGCGDKWAPANCHSEMKLSAPLANVILCSEQIPHAFVLENSPLMAKKMVAWLNKYI